MASWSSSGVRLAARADPIRQATEAAVVDFLAASLRPDTVAMKLDHDETLVPYRF